MLQITFDGVIPFVIPEALSGVNPRVTQNNRAVRNVNGLCLLILTAPCYRIRAGRVRVAVNAIPTNICEGVVNDIHFGRIDI
ncbi:hypothetical protein D3C78_1567200 [compost metagenome]